MSRNAVENIDTSLIVPYFLCCQMNMWTTKIKTQPSVNIMYFRIFLNEALILDNKQ
jgi:hypothetical protein